jgi:mannose-6-phosphate isomerase-like protein (cupin superfamily)
LTPAFDGATAVCLAVGFSPLPSGKLVSRIKFKLGIGQTHGENMTMTDAATIAEEVPEVNLPSGVALAKQAGATYVKGRRDWMTYRELGVTEASGGRIRAQVTSSSQSLSEPTGWHVHHCEGQFVYILDGWLDLEFAGGNVVRLAAGDSLYIPGGTPHNEIQTADAFQLVEISVPADMGTEACDPPSA